PNGLWARAGGRDRAGRGVIVGVIDTGIWPEHPSLDDAGFGAPPARWRGRCQVGEQFVANDCNNKLIGARFFAAGFGVGQVLARDYLSPRDADGHGTHTATTAAGNGGVSAPVFGVERGPVSGMAPGARLAVYKACWNGDEGGCAGSDLAAAIDRAVADGVDVINYSIGSDTPALVTPDSVSFLFAQQAGVFVSVSAGNAGPGAGTIGSPASAPWVTSVGASTHSRNFFGTVRLGNGTRFRGASITQAAPEASLVDSAAAGSELCLPGRLRTAAASGNIVLCKRGQNPRVEKSEAVAAAGGRGMILYNELPSEEEVTDNHVVPTVHVSNAAGLAIKRFIARRGDAATARLSAAREVQGRAPSMASFSSRGPNLAAPDVIKPDVTAPGVVILAGNSETPFLGAQDEPFQAISGTSMSAPHVAGVAAVLRQLHPRWSPAALKSALVTTARNSVRDRGGRARAFDFGGGHIAPRSAADPGLVYGARFRSYLGFLCGLGAISRGDCGDLRIRRADPSNLNLPTISVGELAGVQTVKRRVTNVGPAGTYRARVNAPAGMRVSVSPRVLRLSRGETAAYTMVFRRRSGRFGRFRRGSITWSDGDHRVQSPITISPVRLAAPDEVRGRRRTGSERFEVGFGYSGPYSTRARGPVPAERQRARVLDDPTNDVVTALETGVGVTLHRRRIRRNTALARFSLFDAYVDGPNNDLDLFVFGPVPDNPNRQLPLAGASAGGTTAEEVTLRRPRAGRYIVVVHGFDTNGPNARYTLFDWTVAAGGPSRLNVNAPDRARLGRSGNLSARWTNLRGGTKHVGLLIHRSGKRPLGVTVVRIDTDRR
ncbi:MAG: S8 family serine peptidase, partial [Actinomycetota bacterium]